MWVLDNPKDIAEWIEDRRHPNPLADFLHCRSFRRTQFD
jgi:hypothetical protein